MCVCGLVCFCVLFVELEIFKGRFGSLVYVWRGEAFFGIEVYEEGFVGVRMVDVFVLISFYYIFV